MRCFRASRLVFVLGVKVDVVAVEFGCQLFAFQYADLACATV